MRNRECKGWQEKIKRKSGLKSEAGRLNDRFQGVGGAVWLPKVRKVRSIVLLRALCSSGRCSPLWMSSQRCLPGSVEKCLHVRRKSTFVPTLTSDSCTRLAHISLRIHWPFQRHVFCGKRHIYLKWVRYRQFRSKQVKRLFLKSTSEGPALHRGAVPFLCADQQKKGGRICRAGGMSATSPLCWRAPHLLGCSFLSTCLPPLLRLTLCVPSRTDPIAHSLALGPSWVWAFHLRAWYALQRPTSPSPLYHPL